MAWLSTLILFVRFVVVGDSTIGPRRVCKWWGIGDDDVVSWVNVDGYILLLPLGPFAVEKSPPALP